VAQPWHSATRRLSATAEYRDSRMYKVWLAMNDPHFRSVFRIFRLARPDSSEQTPAPPKRAGYSEPKPVTRNRRNRCDLHALSSIHANLKSGEPIGPTPRSAAC
jgi:hypothetical protein